MLAEIETDKANMEMEALGAGRAAQDPRSRGRQGARWARSSASSPTPRRTSAPCSRQAPAAAAAAPAPAPAAVTRFGGCASGARCRRACGGRGTARPRGASSGRRHGPDTGDRPGCAGRPRRRHASRRARSPGPWPRARTSRWRRWPAAVPVAASSSATSRATPRARRRTPAAPAAAAPARRASPSPRSPPARSFPLSNMRKTIARRLAESKFTAPHFYVTVEIDMDAAVALREQLLKGENVKVSFNDLVVKACAKALTRFPMVNASWGGDKIATHGEVHIGVAVSIPDGLITPVVRNADRKSVRRHLPRGEGPRRRAPARRSCRPEEFMGSTFTHLEPRHVRRHRVHRDHQPARERHPRRGRGRGRCRSSTGDKIAIGHRMKVTLSADHRVVDGALAAQFLQPKCGGCSRTRSACSSRPDASMSDEPAVSEGHAGLSKHRLEALTDGPDLTIRSRATAGVDHWSPAIPLSAPGSAASGIPARSPRSASGSRR